MTKLSVNECSSSCFSFIASFTLLVLTLIWTIFDLLSYVKIYIDDNDYLFVIIRITDIWYIFVRVVYFKFALVKRTNTQNMNILHIHLRNFYPLCVIHLGLYRTNMQIESHQTLSKISCYIKVTVIRFMFRYLLHINLIRKLLQLPNNLWNILQTEIINSIPCLFVFLWPSNGLDYQRGNKPLSWSFLTIFWLWWFDFHIVQTTKIQRDI